MVDAIIKELSIRSDFLSTRLLNSVYFGGGTPSLLSQRELSTIMESINSIYDLSTDCEVTLEANPDDITQSKAKEIKASGINRISIGIQSFYDEDLKFMTRAHSAAESHQALQALLSAGFDRITADLIYGFPLLSMDKLQGNIDSLLSYDIQHISAYALTVEPKTALHHRWKNQLWTPMEDSQVARQFRHIEDALYQAGFEHYEVSNYAKPGAYAVHNTNYWNNTPYLGIGPSAHAYDGQDRYWNVSNNQQYMKSISEGIIENTKEQLSAHDRYNEYVMTSLRTQWGLNKNKLKESHAAFHDHFLQEVGAKLKTGEISETADHYQLSREGLLFADRIASDLFYIAS